VLILEVTHLPLKFHLDSLRFERGFCVCIFEVPLLSSSCCLGLFLRRSLLEREGLRRARRLQSEAARSEAAERGGARRTRSAHATGGRRRAAARGGVRQSSSQSQQQALACLERPEGSWPNQAGPRPTRQHWARGPRANQEVRFFRFYI
jgi:hypothetical protein